MLLISVVIPAFNEVARLPATLVALRVLCENKNSLFEISEVLVINDGSWDQTAACVEDAAKTWALLKLISFTENKGKGAAVQEGLRQATSPWILVADADMATPWEEVFKLVVYGSEASLIMGSRALPESDILIHQHWFRESMGKSFNKILQRIVGLPFKDTQCGFKLLCNDEFFRTQILPLLRVARFSWDVELILFYVKAGRRILEVPIRWQHKEESRVRLVRDSCEMLLSVLKMKLCWRWRG